MDKATKRCCNEREFEMNKHAIDLESLIQKADAYPPLPMAVVDAGETYVMEGAWEAARHGLIEPVLDPAFERGFHPPPQKGKRGTVCLDQSPFLRPHEALRSDQTR